MIKNWEIIREILVRLEESLTPNTELNAKIISAFPEQDVAYNMRLLHDAGYISAVFLETDGAEGLINFAHAKHLTNAGHELLEIMRNKTVWGKVKETFKTKGLEMSFDLVTTVGKKIMETILSS